MNKKILIGIVSMVILIIFLFMFVFPNSKVGEKISPIQIIKYSDENSSIIITKNNLDKSANIEMQLFMEGTELKNDFIDGTEFATIITCGAMQLAFFDPEGLEELNNVVNEWNSLEGVVENEEGETIGAPQENVLEGYDIKKVDFYLKDKSTKETYSNCVITGKGEEGIEVNYY